MLQNAKFYLINNVSKSVGNSSVSFVEPAKIIPLTTDDVNINASKNLEVRLAEQIPYAEWQLAVAFSGFNVRFIGSEFQDIRQQNSVVVVSGEILKRLHSLILYNARNARLKMKMRLELCVQSEIVRAGNATDNQLTTSVNYETDLFPDVDEHGNVFYSNPNSSNSDLGTSVLGRKILTLNCAEYKNQTQLRNFRLWVEGIDFDWSDWSHASHPDAMVGQKRLLETGLWSDVTILTMDDSSIRCHTIVLISQSSVLETMLKDKVYVEGQTGEISMKDRTKDVVMSFLAFLYYADLKKTVNDTDLAVTLSEMAHYYDVKGLENGIKLVLLSRPAESFEVDAALRLFNVACGSSDFDLKRKAADVLETKSNEEVLKSPLFNGLSAAVVRELFVVARRMF